MRSLVAYLFVLSQLMTSAEADNGARSLRQAELGFGSGLAHFVVHHPPDPVNIMTGNMVLPVADLYIPCFGFPLEVKRTYNSVSRRLGPFGVGWKYQYDVRIAVTAGETLTVIEPDGFINTYRRIEGGKIDRSEVEQIVRAKQREDVRYVGQMKSAKYYAEIKARLLKDVKYFQRQRNIYIAKKVRRSDLGTYVSDRRGLTTIERTKSGYERRLNDGTVEYYDQLGFLTKVKDRYRNQLTFRYNSQKQLEKAQDSCGHSYKLGYNSDGRIISITDNSLRSLSYRYDRKQRLIGVRGLNGLEVRYSYDKRHRMVSLLLPKSAKKVDKVTIRYDRSGRVAKQSGPGKKVTSYTYGSKGKRYRWAGISDNQGLDDKYEYWPLLNKSVHTIGKDTRISTKLSECCGKPVEIRRSGEPTEYYKYDGEHRLVSKREGLRGETAYTYEMPYNQIAKVTTPEGVSTRFAYDSRGALAYVRNDNGEELRLKPHPRGAISSISDHRGNLILFHYDESGNRILIEKTERRGGKERQVGEVRIAYTKNGALKSVTAVPREASVLANIRTTLTNYARILEPAGINFDL